MKLAIILMQFIYGGFGLSNSHVGGELHAGLSSKRIAVSGGYNVSLSSSDPALLQFRAGYLVNNKWHLYGGPVRVFKSADRPCENSKTYVLGFQRIAKEVDNGSLYYSLSAFGNGYLFATIGFGFNYFRGR